ncbi:hypothetical protein C3D71_20205 [Cronobacter sakazakii]|nr:hypothetical protein AUN10_12305 [Cronobacter sakazakii]PUE76204.1 hypothetical protein C3D71_20205 [Cronobacter sakazakii]
MGARRSSGFSSVWSSSPFLVQKILFIYTVFIYDDVAVTACDTGPHLNGRNKESWLKRVVPSVP